MIRGRARMHALPHVRCHARTHHARELALLCQCVLLVDLKRCAASASSRRAGYSIGPVSPPSGDDFDHPWLIERIPEEILGRYRKAMFRVRSSNEPLVILDSLAEMKDALRQVERAAVEEAQAQGATWSQIAEALQVTRQAVVQRFG